MNTIDAIYTRHQRSLMAVDQASDVVLFSLRLALEELAASAAPDRPANLSQAERDRDMLAAEIHNLQAWLDSSGQAIEGRGTIGSAINTLDTLNQRNAYQAEKIDDLNRQIATLSAYVEQASSAISNQQSPINNQPPPNPPPAPLPLDLSSLAPDELHQVVAVQSGENAWRTLAKPLRMKVTYLTLRQLAAAKGSRITPDEWDKQRPSWMPTNGSVTYMLSRKWSEIPQE